MTGEMPGEPIDLLEELLEVRGRDVLDIGCGAGGLSRRLAAAGARVVGVDPSAAALARARANPRSGEATRYLEGTAEALPVPGESFDVAVFFNSLHHVPVPAMDEALEEAARVLRPGGVLYVQEPKAEGSVFELLRPVDDETAVRGAAQEALERAIGESFTRRSSREVVLAVRHADFDTLREHIVGVDPARAAALAEHEADLLAKFERVGRPADAGGMVFDQPFRIDVLELRAGTS